MTNVETAVSITMEYTNDGLGPLPSFQGITLKNITGVDINSCGEIVCEVNSQCTDMTFQDIKLDAKKNYEKCQYVIGTQSHVSPPIPCLGGP
jgi:hypothetical protein